MSASRVPRTGMESTRAILRRMLEAPRNPLIVREPHAPTRCVWCGEEIASDQPVYEFAGRLLHDGAEAPDGRVRKTGCTPESCACGQYRPRDDGSEVCECGCLVCDRPLFQKAGSAPDCRREFDAFIGDE